MSCKRRPKKARTRFRCTPSNAYGRIKGAELWHKDVWEANKPLLTDMAEQFGSLMSNVEILSVEAD